jgi:hydroxymethylpyrimidine/phosphomethylpyrimidine kinase
LEFQTTPPLPAKPPVALTIAGFDPSSGAGITADLQVFQAHGLFGTSAITALTVQSTLGVQGVESVSKRLISETLKALVFDLPPQGIKIGMLGGLQGVEAVSDFLVALSSHRNGKYHIPIVLDPVMQSSSGAELLTPEALSYLRDRLLPQVDWITPNWQELALLASTEVSSEAQAEAAARVLGLRYPSLGLIVTGGDQTVPTDLFLSSEGEAECLSGEHVETCSTHGTGCAFSTAFLSNLILQKPALDAAQKAKRYVAEAMRRAPGLGGGRGPLNLLWPLR